ncbi:MAG: hypothetical protein COX66_14260 [Elusimicrobia bacterium CG_4_10_14_0_2_um_filter_63_34]|nr:MAG: hypothetical protein COX66_14260 [Elusimicrobia bacterium CG_4_10_14_0_2_um_filter_63_34]
MKYMEQGGFQHKPFMRLTLLWTLVFLTGLWITNFAMYFSRMGLDPASVVSYYCGSEAEFRAPRSMASMLEVSHVHLPIMGIVVLMLTHLLIFAPFKDKTKFSFICTAFLAALLSEGGGWLVRFVDPGFAVVKVAAFLVFQATLAFLLGALGIFLLNGMKEQRKRKKTG